MAEVTDQVRVIVVETTGGREISWGSDRLQDLRNRLSDVTAGLSAGVQTVGAALPDLHGAEGWIISEVKAKFGLTLSVDAGVVVSKAGVDATFECEVTFTRNHEDQAS